MTATYMKNFDFEAGKRFREEGDIAEALRCLRSALEEDKNSVETYVELARTYILAFGDSGDPLCLDSARKVCLSGLRREPTDAQRRRLFAIQEQVEDLLLESQKAEADAMTDAMADGAFPGGIAEEGVEPHNDAGIEPGGDEIEDDLEEERGH